jgi:serine/threonine-protein kinase
VERVNTAPRILGGRYEVGDLIGRGGMADVYLGHDARLGRQVAIKMLRSDLARDHNFLMRFRREAQSAASLNHPNIVAIFDSGEDEVLDAGGARHTLPFIVMEYVDGQTLRQRLADVNRLDPAEAIEMTRGVLEALAYSHRMGIVHRDIKPANVMITSHGHVKVMDFGIARAIADTAATMTATQSVVGTAQYLSPEQAQGQTVDARSDLYSTGCLLFELLTGRTPFTGDSAVAIAYQHVGEAPQPPSIWTDAVGGDLDAVTLHALAKDREARYQTAADFLDDLEAVRVGRPISAAALGSGALAGAAATQTLPQGYAAAGSPTVVQPQITSRRQRYENTAGLPAVGREVDDRDRRGGGGRAALIALLVLALLGLAGWGAVSWFGSQEQPVAMVSVPDLKGMTKAQAEAALQASKLKGEPTAEPNDAPAGQVFAQDPAAKAQVKESSTVKYSVSTGPASVEVPPVAGMTSDDAKQAIADAGLEVSKVVLVDDPSQAKGRVIETVPPAREKVAKGTGIELRVASGKVLVPDDLVGLDWAVVAQRLDALKIRAIKDEVDSAKPSGQVLAVESAGKPVSVNSEITVKVARTPVQTQTPTTTPPPTDTATTTPGLPLPTTPPPIGG